MQFMCDHGYNIVLVTNLHIVIISYESHLTHRALSEALTVSLYLFLLRCCSSASLAWEDIEAASHQASTISTYGTLMSPNKGETALCVITGRRLLVAATGLCVPLAMDQFYSPGQVGVRPSD